MEKKTYAKPAITRMTAKEFVLKTAKSGNEPGSREPKRKTG